MKGRQRPSSPTYDNTKYKQARAYYLYEVRKAMTKLLRHQATRLGLPTQGDGFFRVDHVLAALRTRYRLCANVVDLREAADDRFNFRTNEGSLSIRAIRGHSFSILDDAVHDRIVSYDVSFPRQGVTRLAQQMADLSARFYRIEEQLRENQTWIEWLHQKMNWLLYGE